MSTPLGGRDPDRPADGTEPPRYGEAPGGSSPLADDAPPRYGDAPTVEGPRYVDDSATRPSGGTGSSALGGDRAGASPSGPSPYGPPGADATPYGQSGTGQGYGSPDATPNYAQPTYGQPAAGPGGYGQPAYGQAGGAQPGYDGGYGFAQPKRNGLGIAALVLGVLSLLGILFIIPGLVLGLVAIILGFLARGRVKRGEANNGGIALAGLLTGAVALVISAVLAVVVGFSLRTFFNSDAGRELQSCLQRAGNSASAQAECRTEFQRNLQR